MTTIQLSDDELYTLLIWYNIIPHTTDEDVNLYNKLNDFIETSANIAGDAVDDIIDGSYSEDTIDDHDFYFTSF